MSRPRVSRTVAGTPARTSVSRNASIAFRDEPSYIPVGLYGIRFAFMRELVHNLLGSPTNAALADKAALSAQVRGKADRRSHNLAAVAANPP
jgi:hypothetical protein